MWYYKTENGTCSQIEVFMANYAKGMETKQKLILFAYEKLKTQSASNITVRDLAHESGYAASALYRYFGSLEHLLAVASVGFLDHYIRDYVKLLESEQDFLSLYRRGWLLFNQYAFQRPDIFYALFWGEYTGEFTDAVEEYCQFFPLPGTDKDPEILHEIMFNDDVYKRERILLNKAVAQGSITKEDAAFYSRANPLMVKGILLEAMDKDDTCRKALCAECDSLVLKYPQEIKK